MRRLPARATAHPSRGNSVAGPAPRSAASAVESTANPGPRGASAAGGGAALALDRLAAEILAFRQAFERFFAGDKPNPPVDLRAGIEAQLRELRGPGVRSAQDTFRLGNLEAQFNAYSELFNRRLREREEGPRAANGRRSPRTVAAAATTARPVSRGAAASEDPARGITVAAGSPSAEAVAAIHGNLYANGHAPIDIERFGRYLAEQADSIRQRTGCQAVQFRVAIEDGRPKLKARPVGGPR